MKRLAVLGSTGSIGTSTLSVVAAFRDHFEVVALAAGRNIELLRTQVAEHKPKLVAVDRVERTHLRRATDVDHAAVDGGRGLLPARQRVAELRLPEQVAVDGVQALHGDDALLLVSADGGLALVPLLAGLSWYGSLLVDRPLGAAAARAGAAALLSIPLQLVALPLALASLAAGAGESARSALSHLPWLVIAATGLAWCEIRFRRRGAPDEH